MKIICFFTNIWYNHFISLYGLQEVTSSAGTKLQQG